MEDKLPEGWVKCDLRDIVNIEYGKSLPARKRSGKGYPVYGSNGIVGYHKEYLLNGPVIIIGRKGSIGEINLSNKNCWAIDTTYYVQQFAEMEIQFIFYLLQTLGLNQMNRATAIPGLNREDAYNTKINLPPLSEQRRIVAKLDVAFTQLRKVELALGEVPQLLADFRKSVLYQAVTGKLTEEWRKGRELDVNSLVTLLKEKDRNLKKINKSKNLLSIPTEWRLVNLSFIADIIMGQSPPGTSYNKDNMGTPLINGPVEFGDKPFDKSLKIKFTTKPTNKYCKEKDLLICVRGSTTGRINIAGFDANIGRGVAAIRAVEVNQMYINMFMRLQYEDILSSGTGSTFPSINSDFLNNYIIPLPPIKEQEEIVNRLLYQLKKIELLEQQLTSYIENLTFMKSQILSYAFTGKLVPQNPTDETATELLKKIKVEKVKMEVEMKAQRKKRRAQPKKKQVMKNLEIIEVLKMNAKPMPTKEVWQESKFKNDIDEFYTALRYEVEETENVLSMVAENQETYLSLKTKTNS